MEGKEEGIFTEAHQDFIFPGSVRTSYTKRNVVFQTKLKENKSLRF